MTDNFKRDSSSKALLNTDVESLRQYKAQKTLLKRVSKLEEQVMLLMERLNILENNNGQTD